MHQAPAAIWNAIAETQDLKTAWAKQMFPLPAEEMELALEREEQRLMDEGNSGQVASAWLLTMPLLWEQDAIRAFKAMGGPGNSLPMVETVQEAVMLASREYPMTTAQQASLAKLLETPPT